MQLQHAAGRNPNYQLAALLFPHLATSTVQEGVHTSLLTLLPTPLSHIPTCLSLFLTPLGAMSTLARSPVCHGGVAHEQRFWREWRAQQGLATTGAAGCVCVVHTVGLCYCWTFNQAARRARGPVRRVAIILAVCGACISFALQPTQTAIHTFAPMSHFHTFVTPSHIHHTHTMQGAGSLHPSLACYHDGFTCNGEQHGPADIPTGVY